MKLPKGFSTLVSPYGEYQIESIAFGIIHKQAGLLLDLGLGKCIHPDTLITTDKGPKRIEDIWSNPGIINQISTTEEIKLLDSPIELKSIDRYGNVTITKTATIYKQLINESICKILLHNGEDLITTESHKHLIFNGENIVWKASPNIGEYIISPRIQQIYECKNKISENVAKFLGWQIAEGHERVQKSTSVIIISQKDVNILLDLKEIFTKEINSKYEPTIDLKQKIPALIIRNIDYTNFLRNIGYTVGFLSRNKRIPDFIFKEHKKVKAALLRALFDAESSITKEGTIELSSASFLLVKQIQFLLAEFGILSSIRKKNKYATNTVNKQVREYYLLYIYSEYHYNYDKYIGYSVEYKDIILKNNLNRKNKNPNTGIPVGNLLNEFRLKTKLTGKFFGISNAAFYETLKQGLSIKSCDLLITNLQKVLCSQSIRDIKVEKNYKRQISLGNVKRYRNDLISLRNKLIELRRFHYTKIIKTETIPYNGYVFDLSVPETENYISGNYVLHNTYCAINTARYRIQNNNVKTILVVAPNSLLKNWYNEIKKFSEYKPIILQAVDREERVARIRALNSKKFQFGIINYEALHIFGRELSNLYPGMIIFDESARYLKNIETWRTKTAILLADKADYTLLLTGTLFNKPEDIFSQFRILDWGMSFGLNFYRFRNIYFNSEKLGAYKKYSIREERIPEINKKIFSLCIRKTKKECLPELPEQLFSEIVVEMDRNLKQVYDEVKKKIIAEILTLEGTKEFNITNILTKLLRLQQVTSGFISEKGVPYELEFKPKLQALLDRIELICDVEESAVVWCRFLYSIDMISRELNKRKIKHITMSGKTKNNYERWKGFQECKDFPIFIGQIESGGIGIELFKHNSNAKHQHMLFYENTFSNETRTQATGRIHRIGQESVCIYTDFLVENSIDTRILESIKKDQVIIKDIMEKGFKNYLK
uniref:Helicase n=1 Tax=viral metagenome TaxID=1070528 RepID=A0A6M3XDL0_9ZZZZ